MLDGNRLEAAKRLRRERRLREITQQEMASAIGVSLTIYNRIEKHPELRAVRIAELERAATYLGIDFADLWPTQRQAA